MSTFLTTTFLQLNIVNTTFFLTCAWGNYFHKHSNATLNADNQL